MTDLSRRQFLQGLAAAYGMSVMGCRRGGDAFAQEHVCIHIFDPAESVAEPLLKRSNPPYRRAADGDYFEIGLPELVTCTTGTRFLEMFQYFWPFSRDDFERLQRSIEIRYSKPAISGGPDVDDFTRHLREHRSELANGRGSSAVVFTYNDFTCHWVSELITASQQAGIDEFVLFKDPTLAPYLCTYPALQKGFKRPPPP